jgi:hypothetical protein
VGGPNDFNNHHAAHGRRLAIGGDLKSLIAKAVDFVLLERKALHSHNSFFVGSFAWPIIASLNMSSPIAALQPRLGRDSRIAAVSLDKLRDRVGVQTSGRFAFALKGRFNGFQTPQAFDK